MSVAALPSVLGNGQRFDCDNKTLSEPTTMTDITNTADIIDVRNIIERIEELREQRDNYLAAKDAWEQARENVRFHHSDAEDLADALRRDYPECIEALELQEAFEAETPLDDEEAAELAELESLMADLKGHGGDEQWEGAWYPITLVRDSYFEDFAQEEAESCGLIDADAKWPYTCIDWEQAARELRMDYSSVEYGGITYLYR